MSMNDDDFEMLSDEAKGIIKRLRDERDEAKQALEAKFAEGKEAAKAEFEARSTIGSWTQAYHPEKKEDEGLRDTFLRLHATPEEQTEENFHAFAKSVGREPVKDDAGASEQPGTTVTAGTTAPKKDDFHQTGGADAGSKRYDREEWLQLVGTDPKAAEAAFKSGQVDLSEVTAGLGPDR